MPTEYVFLLFRHPDGRFFLRFQDHSITIGAYKFSFFGGPIIQGVGSSDPAIVAKQVADQWLHIQLMNGEASSPVQLLDSSTGESLFVFSARIRLEWPIRIMKGPGACFFSLQELLELSTRGILTHHANVILGSIESGKIVLPK